MSHVYLLHFEKPLHHAGHYIGFADRNLERRIQQHIDGQGAKLTKAVRAAGIEIELALTWEGDRHFERRLKNRKKARQLCPICRAAQQPKP